MIFEKESGMSILKATVVMWDPEDGSPAYSEWCVRGVHVRINDAGDAEAYELCWGHSNTEIVPLRVHLLAAKFKATGKTVSVPLIDWGTEPDDRDDDED